MWSKFAVLIVTRKRKQRKGKKKKKLKIEKRTELGRSVDGREGGLGHRGRDFKRGSDDEPHLSKEIYSSHGLD